MAGPCCGRVCGRVVRMADLKRAWMPMMKTPPREEGVGHPDGHLGDACVSEQEAAQHGPREAVEVGENHNRRGHRMGMPNSRWRDECAARAEEARLEDHGRRGHEKREANDAYIKTRPRELRRLQDFDGASRDRIGGGEP
eukprot:CAMPEP_0184719284 /NCGR_PEP_ID=MMETSP0314-20130426/8248_1 /TAXON_ID=38298 /ORGANISM="Rhodella maculata, Strain CCMP 736" /LENGTH=139 /DNA_ID=CAMNT_0027183147 /DNA_START=276 /DNA_END=695 /DNA_ORIENTATION=-